MENIIIYSADRCKFCDEAKAIFQEYAVPYEERNVNRSIQYLREARELGNRWLPIIKVGDRVFVSPSNDEVRQFVQGMVSSI